ncbi:hypothetical protein [Bradyrhizobium sp. McL0615]|uniref:hypothetical protein n=1 Tax=Bradyrhizobium sp. McL0615 TaxID=3415673 RepID=UPI003CF183E8
MNDDFYKQRAREVRDIAAKADPFIKKRLLDLADRYDGKRKTSVTPLHRRQPPIRTRPANTTAIPARRPAQSLAAISRRSNAFGNGPVFAVATGTD